MYEQHKHILQKNMFWNYKGLKKFEEIKCTI